MIMRDGFSTVYLFSQPGAPINPVVFYEKEVKPLGWDSGGKIDTTGMWNNALRTGAPKALVTGTAMTAVVAYDPAIIVSILAIAGVIGDVTIFYPDGETVVVSGCWLDKFEPNPHTEGNQPTANITIEVGNSTTGLPGGGETEPVFTGV